MTEFEKISRVGPAMPANGYGGGSPSQARANTGAGVNATQAAMVALNEPAAASEAPAVGVDPSQLQKLVGEIQGRVQDVQRALQFSVDEESGATVVKVIDTQTKEVIRQIPAEEVLSIASRLRAAAGGLLLADTV
jgi:flagellar protein FlaG